MMPMKLYDFLGSLDIERYLNKPEISLIKCLVQCFIHNKCSLNPWKLFFSWCCKKQEERLPILHPHREADSQKSSH